MSTLFLFGAGASAFSGPCAPQAPPLGTSLFDELARRGGVAATVEADLAAVFRQNFELGMTGFRKSHGAEVTTLLLEMADYFARFKPEPGNLYAQLLAGMLGTRRKFAIATLNYELLCELAATDVGSTISYTLENPSPGSIVVLKPHGSCNFLPDVAPRQFYNFSVNIPDTSKRASILDGPVRIASNTHEVIEFCERENAVAPAIALYEKGKDTLFCPSFIEVQQREFVVAVGRASRLFVIGVRVNESDEHIWQPIARARAPLYYAGPDPSELFAWTTKHRRRGTYHFATSFQEAVPKILSFHTHGR